ncbi:MAG TPA: aminomethyl transferase family protein [Sphingobium sp.]|nr:aminomethyl transferase family protein [Sphingobium sp.]
MADVANGAKSLEARIQEAGSPLKLLRRSPVGAFVFPNIPPEHTSWRDEQRAWRQDCVLVDMSFHMTELHIRGADCVKLLAGLATNKLDPFPVLRGKQLIFLGHNGYMIGDVIAFREAEDHVRLVGAPSAIHWVQFNAETGNFNVEVVRRESFYGRSGDSPDEFRIQVQGPKALALMQEVTDKTLPDIKFFHIGEFKISGRPVRALRHGMAGEAGFEIYGPWASKADIVAALEETGRKYGFRRVGYMAMTTPSQESGWMPLPLPAIYDGAEMKPYREWLSGNALESIASLGGSYHSDDIADYYLEPVEMGYKGLIDFEHDFVGRDAVRKIVENPRRKRVTLEWNNDDVLACFGSALTDPGNGGMYMKLPNPMYATFQSDTIRKNGNHIGISQCLSFSVNAGCMISPSVVDIEHAEPGTEVVVLWGEKNSERPVVDKHQIREIRGRIAPSPYFKRVNKSENL